MRCVNLYVKPIIHQLYGNKSKNTQSSFTFDFERKIMSNENKENKNDNNSEEKKSDETKQTPTLKDINAMSNILSSCPLMIPFWSKILQCNRILIAGCGGGYDCFQGIPMYFALKTLGKQVFIANYTLTNNLHHYDFEGMKSWLSGKSLLYKVNYKKHPKVTAKYFPEYFLSKWFYEHEKTDITIYTFRRWGVSKLTKAYNILIDKLNIDGIIVMDGGTDSLMDGTELQTGTICEDYTSMFAAHLLDNKNIKHKMHAILGLGVDRFHGTSDVSSWRAIAELKLNGGFLGCISLMNSMECVKKYRLASEYCYQYMQKSIVGTSILDAIEGRFGDYHSNDRTKNSKLFINPAMSFYFLFDLGKCVERIHPKYLELMKDTKTNDDAGDAVMAVRTWLVKNNKVLTKHEDFPKTTEF
eukprot:219791_1